MNRPANTNWTALYRVGALAPLAALALYCSQFLILAFGDPHPTTTEGWFALLQRSPVLGLWYLNALDIVSWVLLGAMYLALCVALRHSRPSWMLVAAYVSLLGVVVFLVPRVLTLSMLPLSGLYASASGDAQRTLYLTIGETLTATNAATPQTAGFLLAAAGGLITSAVCLSDRCFAGSASLSMAVGMLGIAGFVVALASYAGGLLSLPIAAFLMPANGLLWLLWWLLISTGLFKLARGSADQ
jgi:hypothetical protein